MARDATYSFLTYSEKTRPNNPSGLDIALQIWSYLTQQLDLIDAQSPKVRPHERRNVPSSDQESSP